MLAAQGHALAESVQSPTMILYRGGKEDLRAISFNEKNNVVYFAAGASLFKYLMTERAARGLSLHAGTVNDIFIDDFSPNTLYVAAEKGAFISEDFGESFHKIYSSSAREDEAYNQARSVIVTGTTAFVGTDEGLFTSAVGNWIWKKNAHVPRNARICDVIADTASKKVIVASDRGIYVGSDDGQVFQRAGINRATADDDQSNNEELERSRITPRCLFYDELTQTIYIGTTNGVYMIPGDGGSYAKKSFGFIDTLSINDIRALPSRPGSFLLATDKGAYVVDSTTGQSALVGISANEPVSAIAVSLARSALFMAARKDLVEADIADSVGQQRPTRSRTEISVIRAEVGQDEPSIDEVRQFALYYNEVGPEKIKQWRRYAQLRALIPSVSLDYDKTIDIYQTATSQRVIEGPRDWGVSFSWDVGDLIWNPYQKDIDTRSRLNTQLRIEIIEEVTRLYFERKRLLLELQALKAGTEEFTKRQLRLDEVTALLDGYTGGLYAKHVKRSS